MNDFKELQIGDWVEWIVSPEVIGGHPQCVVINTTNVAEVIELNLKEGWAVLDNGDIVNRSGPVSLDKIRRVNRKTGRLPEEK